MKKLLYLAVAFLAAAACTREEIIPEEPEIVEKGPIKVTLTAGNPETRTMLSNDLPYWSAGDQLGVTRLWDDYYADYCSNGENYLFSMDTPTTDPISTASFTGSVLPPKDGGTDLYVAYYPYIPVSDYYSVWWYSWDDNGTTRYYQGLQFEIPHEQHPTPTSFDKSADFMISESFTIDPEDPEEYDRSFTRSDLKFIRMNAIVKIVLIDKTTDKRYKGQTVYGVTLGEEPVINRSTAPVSRTRVSIENGTGVQALTGWTYYHPCDGAWNNRDPYCLYSSDYTYPYVKAIYEGDTVYSIGDENAATYVVVFPSVLKEDGTGLLVTIDFGKDLQIARRIILPADIALQPSRMTTLNIGLYDWYNPDYGYQMLGVSPVSFSLTEHWESSDWIKLTLNYQLVDGDPYEDTPIGVLYSTNEADVMAGNGQRVQVASGNGSVELTISDLEPSTTYYIRPYALIGGHYAYMDWAYELETGK